MQLYWSSLLFCWDGGMRHGILSEGVERDERRRKRGRKLLDKRSWKLPLRPQNNRAALLRPTIIPLSLSLSLFSLITWHLSHSPSYKHWSGSRARREQGKESDENMFLWLFHQFGMRLLGVCLIIESFWSQSQWSRTKSSRTCLTCVCWWCVCGPGRGRVVLCLFAWG